MAKYGLVGVFENYQKRATGPTILTMPGVEFAQCKRKFEHNLHKDIRFVYDPYYQYPAATCFGVNLLDTALCHLYTLMAYELREASHYENTFSFHSSLDVWAEIMMNHGKQKWLEPLIQKHIQSYDLLIHVGCIDQRVNNITVQHQKYDAIIGRIIHDYKGNYLRVSMDEGVSAINNHYKNIVQNKNTELSQSG